MKITKKSFKIKISEKIGDVSAMLYSPVKPDAVLLFAHGAGAGMNNKFMEAVSLKLAEEGIASLRFNFPYMEKGKKMPDTKPLCVETISKAAAKAEKLMPGVPLFAGGKSFGGRMTSTAASEDKIPAVKGIIFFGFPLHPPGKPSNERAEHLYRVSQPMLFLQGSRDALADLKFLKPVVKKLGRKAKLFVVDDADHSFHVPKGNKLTDSEVIEILCSEVKKWAESKIA